MSSDSGSIMDDVRAAADAVGNVETPEREPAPVVERPEPNEAPARAEAPGRTRDEGGRFASKPKETPAERPTGEAAKAPEAKQPTSEEPAKQPEAAPAAPQRKAPASWKPLAREKFASLPPEVQEEALRVDGEVQRTLRESAGARKFHQEMQEVIAPYEPHLRASGIEPRQVVKELLQTEHVLRTGSVADRARVVGNLITSYGVDINTLAAVLEGQPPPNGAQQQPQQFRDPRFDQFLGHLQQQAQQRQAAGVSKASQELESFTASAEFFQDVGPDMLAIMQAARQRGQQLSYQEAYERACHANPEVRKILASRATPPPATAQSPAATQRARAAASSVKSTPAGISAPRTGGSTVDEVRAAAAQLRGR